jgi:hypothetical protein
MYVFIYVNICIFTYIYMAYRVGARVCVRDCSCVSVPPIIIIVIITVPVVVINGRVRAGAKQRGHYVDACMGGAQEGSNVQRRAPVGNGGTGGGTGSSGSHPSARADRPQRPTCLLRICRYCSGCPAMRRR